MISQSGTKRTVIGTIRTETSGTDRTVILAQFQPKWVALYHRNHWHKTNRCIHDEKQVEFEHRKRENLINAFMESKGYNPSADVEFLEEIRPLSEDKIFHATNGRIEIDVLFLKTGQETLIGKKIDEPKFTDLLVQNPEIGISDFKRTKCLFLTENDFGKAKYSWINLFK